MTGSVKKKLDLKTDGHTHQCAHGFIDGQTRGCVGQ